MVSANSAGRASRAHAVGRISGISRGDAQKNPYNPHSLNLADEPRFLRGRDDLVPGVARFVRRHAGVRELRVRIDHLQVGATIPAFDALDEHGERFDSASLEGHPVLIKFFRAHW